MHEPERGRDRFHRLINCDVTNRRGSPLTGASKPISTNTRWPDWSAVCSVALGVYVTVYVRSCDATNRAA